MYYLNDSDFKLGTTQGFFSYSTKKDVQKLAQSLMERIFDLKSQDQVEKPVLKINFCDDIEKYVQTDTKASGCKSSFSPQFNDIKKEWKGFDLLGQRSKNLELLFQALNSISPTKGF